VTGKRHCSSTWLERSLQTGLNGFCGFFQHAISAEKESLPCPSRGIPVGGFQLEEGQTDTPINHHPLGEVPTNPSPVSPMGEKLCAPPTKN